MSAESLLLLADVLIYSFYKVVEWKSTSCFCCGYNINIMVYFALYLATVFTKDSD